MSRVESSGLCSSCMLVYSEYRLACTEHGATGGQNASYCNIPLLGCQVACDNCNIFQYYHGLQYRYCTGGHRYSSTYNTTRIRTYDYTCTYCSTQCTYTRTLCTGTRVSTGTGTWVVLEDEAAYPGTRVTVLEYSSGTTHVHTCTAILHRYFNIGISMQSGSQVFQYRYGHIANIAIIRVLHVYRYLSTVLLHWIQ